MSTPISRSGILRGTVLADEGPAPKLVSERATLPDPPPPGRRIEVSGALEIVEVEVDTRLGRVLRSHTGVAAGHIVVPALARSQVLGGVIQGIGYALYEERPSIPSTGVQLTAGLEDYRFPGIGDIGELDVAFMEDGYERVTGRSVGLAELVTLAPAAAIGNALAHATGWRPRELPLRPDRLLQGVRGVIELLTTLDAAIGRQASPGPAAPASPSGAASTCRKRPSSI